MLEIGIKRRGISFSLFSGIPAIRYNYTQYLFYIGYGPLNSTDNDDIIIKRVIVDPSDGSVLENYSTNPWTNFADGPWSPTPP
jgi:hypothetical protein